MQCLPKRFTSSKSREQSASDEEEYCKIIHYDYDFSADKNNNFKLAASVNGNVPLNYEEAILSADAEKWQAALQKEFRSLVENRKWDQVASSSGKYLTKGKWVFDIKRKNDGSLERYKARYVAKGFSHFYRQKYTDTFFHVLLL